MLQAQPIGARAFDAAADVATTAGPAPDHVDPLLWKLASPVERELLRFVAGQGASSRAADAAPSFAAGTLGQVAAPRSAAVPAANDTPAPASTPAATSPEQAALVKITDQFRARFTEAAKDPAKFNEMLTKAFGDRWDATAAEGLRQQALRNDFRWMPKVEVVNGSQLADQSGTQGEGVGRGAYAKDSDTLYLSRELLLSDPAAAGRVLTEEMGHAIDARINVQDAAGDEGDIFNALLHGDNVTDAQLQAMRADNDHGTITVNGRQVEVEYGFLKKAFKKIKKAFNSVTDFVKNTFQAGLNVVIGLATFDVNRVKQGLEDGFDAAKKLVKDAIAQVKETWNDIKGAFKKLMQSAIFNYILMVARFIPIPIVQAVVQVINLVKAAYSVYQGVKNKSWGAVVGGVASLAGGAAGVAGNLGASASTVASIQSFANTARNVSTAYNAVASKNFGDAAMLAAQAFGAPQGVTDTIRTAATVEKTVKAIETKDVAGALGGVANLAGGQAGQALGVRQGTVDTLKDAANTAGQVQAAVKAVERNDHAGAFAGVAQLADGTLGRQLGVSDAAAERLQDAAAEAALVQKVVKAVQKDQHGLALTHVADLAGTATGAAIGVTGDNAGAIRRAGEKVGQIEKVAEALENRQYKEAVKAGREVLGAETDTTTPAAPAKPAPAQVLADLWATWEPARTRP